MSDIRELMPEWAALLDETDADELNALTKSSKNFEFQIPRLAAEMSMVILMGLLKSEELLAFVGAFAQATYYMGYQRGKKERKLTFVVREEAEE